VPVVVVVVVVVGAVAIAVAYVVVVVAIAVAVTIPSPLPCLFDCRVSAAAAVVVVVVVISLPPPPLCADTSQFTRADTTPTRRPTSRHGAMSPTWSMSCRRHCADMSACLSFLGEKIPDATPTFPAKKTSKGTK
jgi:hypothetical protein